MMPTAPNNPQSPQFTLAELADRLGGRAEGSAEFLLNGAAGLSEAGPADVTFVESAKLLPKAATGCAGVVLLPEGLELAGRNLIRVDNPRLAFAMALELFHPSPRRPAGIHITAVVEVGAVVDPTASVAAFCFIGARARIGARAVLHPHVYVGPDAVIGDDALLHPGAIARERVILGKRVIVHCGAVVGSDGFGYVFDGRSHHKIPQVGTVEIGADVEIGAGATIDRATTGVTRIGRGTKIDNLVQVAHNANIGENVILVSQSGVAGSATIGNGAVIAGQAAIGDHAVVGAGATVAGRAAVIKHVAAGATVAGFGPQGHGDFLRSQSVFEQLPQLRRRIIELEKRLAATQPAVGCARDQGR